uniref:Integrase catalytic domain-containing protein n=1 Tax=Haemonchus contortus TaxID=6289 RepID=A0A7I5E6D1_HAECO
MTCDIEAAFTQIRLQTNHKDLCRFLWFQDPDLPPTRDNIVDYRFKRNPFGAKPSPSILNMCLLAFLKSKGTPLSQEIIENLYVDNVLLTAESPSEAIAKYRESKGLFAEIGMNMREYVSNCDEVNYSIPEQDRAPNGIVKILGVEYNTQSDIFSITLKLNKKVSLTKKDVVSQLNSIYDPIGIAGPLTIRLKHLMREIYNSGIGWKDPIPPNLGKEWAKTCQDLNNTTLLLPRPAFRSHREKRTTLYVFADASAIAIAACAYFRHDDPTAITSLISGKTRLTPKKNRQTIPRLETLAILMGIRLAKSIAAICEKYLKQVHILSDSEIALCWIKSARDLPMFVENQKCRILKEKTIIEHKGIPVQFYHVPTDKNPADAGTRGVDATQVHNLPWIHGPQWLSEESASLFLRPMNDILEVDLPNDEKFAKGFDSEFHVVTENKCESISWLSLSRFSRWTSAVRTIARVGKAIHKWVNKTNSKKEKGRWIRLTHLNKFDPNFDITVDDLSRSETVIFKEDHKAISIEELRKRFPQKKIFRDVSGIIRNQSRLQNAAIMCDTKNPIFIEKESELARLLLTEIHVKNAHCGKDHTLCIARQRFWIPRPSGAFKKFLKHCAICKRYQGLPFGAPEMPPLPNDRMVRTQPFENVGCDFMGPFLCKENQKYYICLYTCLTTRAIHLEVVEDMSARTFLNSFIRFISRRGVPKLVRTDCGTNFKLGQHIIESMHDSANNDCSLMSYSANHGIRWIFNPPNAPWMGGAWERMVGTVKRAFAKSIGRRKLSYPELYTVVTEIEAIVNTRPLTSCSSSIEEVPIRPVDFLQRRLQYAILPTNENEHDDPSFDPSLLQSVAQVKQALMHAEQVVEKFWERWHFEYLTQLRELQVINRKQSRHIKLREPKIGEIVLVEQENIPRGSWCFGKIQDVIKSSDGLIRSVKLLMPNKHIWYRPVTKIYPLEISSSRNDITDPPQTAEQKTSKDTAHQGVTNTRPTRVSKKMTLLFIIIIPTHLRTPA